MNFFKALFGSKQVSSEEKTKEEEARDFDVLKYDGVRALRTGQYDHAIRCFVHALKLQGDLEVRDYLSQAYIQKGELPSAYDQLQKLAEAQPDNAEILIRMANVAYMMESYGLMASACEKALLIDDSDALVHFLYAKACLGQDDESNGVAMLSKSLQLQADLHDARLLRGEVLLRQGDTESAAEDCEELLRQLPENEDVLLFHARIETARGHAAEAINIYNKVIELNPFSLPAFQERGLLRQQSGDETGAADDLKQAAELQPEQAQKGGAGASEQDIEQQVEQAYRNSNPLGL